MDDEKADLCKKICKFWSIFALKSKKPNSAPAKIGKNGLNFSAKEWGNLIGL